MGTILLVCFLILYHKQIIVGTVALSILWVLWLTYIKGM